MKGEWRQAQPAIDRVYRGVAPCLAMQKLSQSGQLWRLSSQQLQVLALVCFLPQGQQQQQQRLLRTSHGWAAYTHV